MKQTPIAKRYFFAMANVFRLKNYTENIAVLEKKLILLAPARKALAYFFKKDQSIYFMEVLNTRYQYFICKHIVGLCYSLLTFECMLYQ